MLTISTLLISFAVAGAALTAVTVFFKKHLSVLVTFLQHFCGVWFVFSGIVKAIDPIGTGYKMEDYFASFAQTAEGTWLKGIAPMFPFLSKYANGFSISMIVLEIALGVMLILGIRRKLTAWLFFAVTVFFTLLTGFTYLSGYVPMEANFFDFSKWGKYVPTQMRVTDCGCFGEFLKLDPKISFLKDILLLMPASILFLIGWKKMHVIGGNWLRNAVTIATVAGASLFCVQNTYFDLPVIDFRPFKIGTDVRTQKEKEQEAESKRPLTYVLTNKTDGKIVELPMDQFMKQYKDFPKDQWIYDQRKGETSIPITKISDFHLEIAGQGDVTDEILQEEGWSVMVVAYDLKSDGMVSKTMIVQDTTWKTDTIRLAKGAISQIIRSVQAVTPRNVTVESKKWNENYGKVFREKINPFVEAAEKAGMKVYAATSPNDPATVDAFRHFAQTAYPFYQGDDRLLKTITRSNPGVVIWKNGVVKAMYHELKMPTFDAVKGDFK
jgi:uncharacterized membrane protein YphA (DoxX/SURF4 family)